MNTFIKEQTLMKELAEPNNRPYKPFNVFNSASFLASERLGHEINNNNVQQYNNNVGEQYNILMEATR